MAWGSLPPRGSTGSRHLRMLAMLVGLLVLLPASRVAGLAGTESVVTAELGSEEEPDIYEDLVVWEDWSRGETVDIWSFDFSTGRYRQISDARLNEAHPKVFGDYVVWSATEIEANGLTPSIAVHNLVSKTTRFARELATPGTWPAGSLHSGEAAVPPGLYGEVLVWENLNPDGSYDIFYMNLGSGLVVQVTNDQGVQTLPDVFGNWIVYTAVTDLGGSNENTDLWVYNVQTADKVPVAASPDWDEEQPTIYGNLLIYADYRDDPDRRVTKFEVTDDANLYAVELSPILNGTLLGAPYPLLLRRGHQEEPHLSSNGNRLVWRDFDVNATQADIWTMDLRTGDPELLVQGPADEWEIEIWGDRVVWSDFRADHNEADDVDNWDIYAFCIGTDVCVVVAEDFPVLVLLVGGLMALVVAAAAVTVIQGRRAAHPPPEEETRPRKPPKGKGPRSSPRRPEGEQD